MDEPESIKLAQSLKTHRSGHMLASPVTTSDVCSKNSSCYLSLSVGLIEIDWKDDDIGSFYDIHDLVESDIRYGYNQIWIWRLSWIGLSSPQPL